MNISKQITPLGQMSNLVNMFVIVSNGEKIDRTGFVYGKADEYYIIQWHNAITGEPMIAQLFLPCNMKEWLFVANKETADYIMEDYIKHGKLRYTLYKKKEQTK